MATPRSAGEGNNGGLPNTPPNTTPQNPINAQPVFNRNVFNNENQQPQPTIPTPQLLAQAMCDSIKGYTDYAAKYSKDANYYAMVAYVDMLQNTLMALGYSPYCTALNTDGTGNKGMIPTGTKDCNQQAQAICKINRFLSNPNAITKPILNMPSWTGYYASVVAQLRKDIGSEGCTLNEQNCSASKNQKINTSTSAQNNSTLLILLSAAVIFFLVVAVVKVVRQTK